MEQRGLAWSKLLSLVLSILAVATALVFGVVNYLQANDATDLVAGHLETISDNAAGTYINTRDLKNIASAWVAHPTPVAQDMSADQTATLDLGECQAGLEVQVNQYCFWADSVHRFIVYEDGAYSPWDMTAESDLNRATIKVDFGPPRDGTTFQARSSAPGVWEVLVAGAWQNVGQCSAGMIIAPGQLCVERQSQQPFLVYATDELIEGDDRPLYSDGYAVLFWWKDGEVPHPSNERLHDQEVVSGDHFEAARRSGVSWEIVKAD